MKLTVTFEIGTTEERHQRKTTACMRALPLLPGGSQTARGWSLQKRSTRSCKVLDHVIRRKGAKTRFNQQLLVVKPF